MTEKPMFDLPEEQSAPRSRRSEEQEKRVFVDQMMYLLTGALMAWPQWEDLVLKYKNDITLQRFAHAREIFEQEMCTELEAVLYLSTASMEKPMGHDWFAIYMWLFNRWKPEAAEKMDIGVELLDRNQIDDMNRLRSWIFRTQMNRIKANSREANKKEVAEEKKQLEIEQPSMWELPDDETE